MADAWDDWFGQLTLTGIDPRLWDLSQLLAAFEATLRQHSKDESAWKQTYAALTAEPKEVRDARRQAAAAGQVVQPSSRMTVTDAEAMLARFAASDAQYGG